LINKLTDDNIETFKPVADVVMIKCEKKKNTTESGIILIELETVIERPDHGVITAVGINVKNVKVGNIAYFSQQTGYDFYESDDFLYILVQEEKIFGIIV
jgi:co-chaperonin GroES (HSP10)